MKCPKNSGHQELSERKRPYRSPRILSREPLEGIAATCNPSPPGKTVGDMLCSNGPINS